MDNKSASVKPRFLFARTNGVYGPATLFGVMSKRGVVQVDPFRFVLSNNECVNVETINLAEEVTL